MLIPRKGTNKKPLVWNLSDLNLHQVWGRFIDRILGRYLSTLVVDRYLPASCHHPHPNNINPSIYSVVYVCVGVEPTTENVPAEPPSRHYHRSAMDGDSNLPFWRSRSQSSQNGYYGQHRKTKSLHTIHVSRPPSRVGAFVWCALRLLRC